MMFLLSFLAPAVLVQAAQEADLITMAFEHLHDPMLNMGEMFTHMVLDQYDVPETQKQMVAKVIKSAIIFKTKVNNGECHDLQVELKDLLYLLDAGFTDAIEMHLEFDMGEFSDLEKAWLEWTKDYFLPWFKTLSENYIDGGRLCADIHKNACALLNANEARCDAAPKCEWNGEQCVVFMNEEEGFEEVDEEAGSEEL